MPTKHWTATGATQGRADQEAGIKVEPRIYDWFSHLSAEDPRGHESLPKSGLGPSHAGAFGSASRNGYLAQA